MSYRINAIAIALAAVILLPPIKTVYDTLVTTMLTPIAPNDFTMTFFILLPYALLGLIIFGTIWKLFRGKPQDRF